MSDGKPAFLNDELSKRTSIFGLRLWVVLGICVGAAIVILLFLISLWFTSRRNKRTSLSLPHKNSAIPNVSREIQEIRIDPDAKPDPKPEPDPIHIEIGKHEKVGPGSGSGHGSGEARPGGEAAAAGPEVSHLGWGHWYTLRELEKATNGFTDENVIGEGGYGIVYRGVFDDNTNVAVKNLLNNRYSYINFIVILFIYIIATI